MSPDQIVTGILDCEDCGDEWPRLCGDHADQIVDYADQIELAERRQAVTS